MIYKTAVADYRAAAGDFSTWALSGVSLNASSALQLDFSTALPGRDARDGYNGGNFYNGGDYWVGEATSPILTTEFPFEQAIPSWNAAAPSGTWIEVLIARRRAGLDRVA